MKLLGRNYALRPKAFVGYTYIYTYTYTYLSITIYICICIYTYICALERRFIVSSFGQDVERSPGLEMGLDPQGGVGTMLSEL